MSSNKMAIGQYIEQASESSLATSFRLIFMRNSFLMIILVLLIYLAELAFFIYNLSNHLEKFIDRPHYQTYEVQDSNTSFHKTVNKHGSDKDCGHYSDERADNITDFINDFPTDLALGFYITYIVVYSILFLFDVGLRTYKRYKSLRNGVSDSEGYQPLSGNPDILIDVLVLLFFVLPVYKIASLGILYPITSIKYDTCIKVRWEILIDYKFYYYAMVFGFLLTNGILTLFAVFVFQTSVMKLIFTGGFALVSGGTCCIWTCGIIGCEAYGGSVKCLIGLILLGCTLYVPLYLLFVVFGLPFLTYTESNVGLSFSLIARIIVSYFIELKRR